MAERLPIGSTRNVKSPPFPPLGLPLSDDVSNASVDMLNSQLDGLEVQSYESSNLFPSNGSSTASNHSLYHNKPGQTEAVMRTGIGIKENDSRYENESVEQEEPGVYITLTSLPGGLKDLKRVRFRYVSCYFSLAFFVDLITLATLFKLEMHDMLALPSMEKLTRNIP